MQEIIIDKSKWIVWLQAKRLSPRTIIEYCKYFDKFDFAKLSQEYLNLFVTKNNNNVAGAFLTNFLHYIKTSDFSPELRTIARDLEIPKISGRAKMRLPDVLNKEQVELVSKAMSCERDSLMLLVTFYGGLRVSEMLGIKPFDFNWDVWLRKPEENGRLKVIGKGDKQRGVFIPQPLMARLYQWIKAEASHRQSRDAPLFSIHQSRWKFLLDEASRKAIQRHVNPHLLRHSCGTWLKENGWDMKEIQEYLGHSSIVTTQIYVHTSQEKLKDKFAKLTQNGQTEQTQE